MKSLMPEHRLVGYKAAGVADRLLTISIVRYAIAILAVSCALASDSSQDRTMRSRWAND